MLVFFAITALIGGALIWIDFDETPDAWPTEVTGHAGAGIAMIGVAVLGAICVWFFG